MSYILEALRRADAERQRGDVPGLHAQPQAITAGEPAPVRWPPGLLAGAALGLLLLGGALVWWWTGGAARQAPPPVVAMAPALQPPTAPPLLPGQVAGPVPGGAPAALPLPSLPPAVASVVVPAGPAPRAAPAPVARALPLPAAPPARVVPAAPSPAAVAPPAAPVRVLKLSELPEDLRRDLPAIAPGGSVYAEHAPARMVILNGQVFHEGDRPAPGLQVQQIRPRSVVFDFKGQRFELPL